AYADREGRGQVPPILVFANTGEWRDVIFLGLAVPGVPDQRIAEQLVAIWKIANGKRFQNYRARFTILNAPVVSRAWLAENVNGHGLASDRAPSEWREWVEKGRYRVLRATRSLEHRTKAEQLPADTGRAAIVRTIHSFFAKQPDRFEACAAEIARMLLPEIAT